MVLRRFILLLMLVPVVSLPGCSNRADVSADGRKIVRLHLLLISTKQVEHFQWIERTFEELNPDIDVLFEQFPGSSLKDYEIKLKLGLASKKAPDVVGVGLALAEELARLGYLHEAPDYIEQRIGEASTNDMVRSAPYFYGACYGIVSDATPTALYYNKSMFRNAGLDPDVPPATMDEFVSFAEVLTERNDAGEPTRAGLSLRKTGFKPGIAEKWLTFLFSEGGRAFSEDGKRAAFNSEAGRRALERYKSVLFDKNIDSVRLEGDQQAFGQKAAAMFIREVHVIRWLQENYPDLDFGVAPIPAGEASISAGAPYLFVVPTDTRYPEESWRLIDYMMSDSVYSRYASIGGVIPTVRAVAEEDRYKNDPFLKVFVEQDMKTVQPFPRFYQTMEILGAYIERFCYGRIGLEETLERAEQEINAILAVT